MTLIEKLQAFTQKFSLTFNSEEERQENDAQTAADASDSVDATDAAIADAAADTDAAGAASDAADATDNVTLADQPENPNAAPADTQPTELETVMARVDELAAQVQNLTDALAAVQGERDAAQAEAVSLRSEVAKLQDTPADTKVSLAAHTPATQTKAQEMLARHLARQKSR